MAAWLSRLSRWWYSGFTQVRVAHGVVSWGSKDDDAVGELQLWYRESNDNVIYVCNTAGDGMAVCKVIDVLLFTSKSALTKSKRY